MPIEYRVTTRLRYARLDHLAGRPLEVLDEKAIVLRRGRGRLVGCGCIFNRLAVRADGAYVPCVMLPQMVLGKIGEDRLEQVWQESAALKELQARWSVPLSSFAECQGCRWQANCTGNCAGTAACR